MPFDLTISDPLGFIAILRRDTNLFKWFSLIFQMALSSSVSFCGTVGIKLVAKSPTPVAIGYGLIAVAVTLSVFFGASELTRGMMLVRPEVLSEAQLKTDISITRRT